MFADGTFSESASQQRASHHTQDSFYSEYGTALSLNSDASSTFRESSAAESSVAWQEPERSHTIFDLEPYLENLLTPAERDRFAAQDGRFRLRRPFPPSHNASFSSGTASTMRSSFGSCKVGVSSSFAAEEGDEQPCDALVACKIATVPEELLSTSTADTLPKCGVIMSDTLPNLAGGSESADCSFASFGGAFGLAERLAFEDSFRATSFGEFEDGAFVDDWPARDAKVVLRPTSQAEQGPSHRRDAVLLPDLEQSSSLRNSVDVVCDERAVGS
eukprot:TRINITY_DN50445_c0_g1_i1.p1 TRINITY_DN50445_c0_g1~~TRINITY_DN50445_c0_g1_i1.p1  ORF type:complete len:274 (-),score=49.91 TRINITY_DN50445_c0_g1_i1:68-889(-)